MRKKLSDNRTEASEGICRRRDVVGRRISGNRCNRSSQGSSRGEKGEARAEGSSGEWGDGEQFNESHRKRKGSGTAKRDRRERGWRVENGRAFRHADVVGERQRERERQRACASFDPPQLRSADGGSG